MHEVKNFALGSLGTLGVMEAADAQIFSAQDADPQTLIIRSAITLLAGVLTTVVSKWMQRNKIEKNNSKNKQITAPKEKGNKVKNIFKVKNNKNK
ncbi:hypothetical protein [Plebeiibacterium marinum]|uniref:Uncharacterized protein n=1 Tax=Plebeiibacterium marinum TaxID=2992111 RepID=A0AAE3MIF5_9BACT|nr:hypothetical protein [Plebeiobacterium marinum]MCW3808036.1 hypothetical protein [Plebeiobacterium marinum]